MLVEEVASQTGPRALNRAQQKAGYAVMDSAARLRQTARHLEELQKDNYVEVKIDLPKTDTADRRKQSLSVRKIVSSKKILQNHKDEMNDGSHAIAAVSPPTYPPRHFCTVCGYWGRYKCGRCGLMNCSNSCITTHKETQCHR